MPGVDDRESSGTPRTAIRLSSPSSKSGAGHDRDTSKERNVHRVPVVGLCSRQPPLVSLRTGLTHLAILPPRADKGVPSRTGKRTRKKDPLKGTGTTLGSRRSPTLASWARLERPEFSFFSILNVNRMYIPKEVSSVQNYSLEYAINMNSDSKRRRGLASAVRAAHVQEVLREHRTAAASDDSETSVGRGRSIV